MNNVDLIRLHISTAVIILSIIVLDADITLFEQDRKWYDETLRWGSGIPIPKARVDYGDLHPGNYQLRDPKWPLLRPILFVVFFLLIMLISVGHIVLLVKGMLLARRRGDTGRASKLTKVGLYSAALSFLLAFVAVVYGWHGAGTKFTLQEVYDNSVHTSYMKGKDEVTNFRDPTGPLAALDSFTWYCALVGPVAYGLTRIGNQFTFAINMDFLCKKAQLIRALSIPVLLLCATMFGIEIWSLYRGRKVSEIQPDFIKMPDDLPGEGDLVPLHGLAAPSQAWRRGGPGYPEGRDPEIMR